MKIKEIMTKEMVSVRPEDKALEALSLLFKREISGLPVLNGEKRLLGMFTEKEVLKQILPSYIEKVGRFVYGEDPKYIKKKLQDLAGAKVSQLMRKEVVTVALGILEKEKNIKITFFRWLGIGLTCGIITTTIVWISLLCLPMYR